jgi:hypothetical protein
MDADHPDVVAWRNSQVRNPTSRLDVARQLLEGVARTIRYKKDPDGKQHVLAPRHVIADRVGDCKKMSTVIASAAYGLGIPFRFAVVAQRRPDDPNHVWAELLTEAGWTAVDPVPRPLALGRLVDGRIEVWDGYARKGAAPMSSTAIQVRNSGRIVIPRRGDPRCRTIAIRRRGEMGLDAGAASGAADTAISAISAMGPYGAAAGAVLSVLKKVFTVLFTVKPFSAADDYPKDVAKAKGVTLPGDGKDRAANMAAILANGWVPIYCSDSVGTRDNIFREFSARGWTGGERWSNKHASIIGTSASWWYGVHFPIAGCPQAIKDAATARMTTIGQEEAAKRILKLCTDAKSFMRSYGGTEDYDTMVVDAYPVAPAAITTAAATMTASKGGTPATTPRLPAATPPALPPAAPARAPTAPARATTAPARAPAALPAAARQVTPPLPPGARVVAPPSASSAVLPSGMTTEEASILAAIRQRAGTDIARRAADAAAAYFGVAGLGATVVEVRLVDIETEGRIRATLPSTSAALAKTDSTGKVIGDLATRAAQVNYALSHLGAAGMDRTRVAERLMAYKRAAGDATPDSRINEAVRTALSRAGGFPIGAVPTLASIAEKLPAGPGASRSPATTSAAAAAADAGMPAGSRQVTAPDGSSPTSAGAAALDPATAAAAGVPAGSRQVSTSTGAATVTTASGTQRSGESILPYVLLGYLVHDAAN